jgi:hypothetical protein
MLGPVLSKSILLSNNPSFEVNKQDYQITPEETLEIFHKRLNHESLMDSIMISTTLFSLFQTVNFKYLSLN